MADLSELEGPICDLKDAARGTQMVWESQERNTSGASGKPEPFVTIHFTHEDYDALTYALRRLFADATSLKRDFYRTVDDDQKSASP